MLDPSRRRVAILANPRAGAGASRRLVEELERGLRNRGLMPVLCWHRAELSALVDSPRRDELRCVVAAGGDGTLLEVVNRAGGLPAALLPVGNENLVARQCGLVPSGRRLAELIALGHVRRFDLAQAGGRLFCLMASAGFDADVVRRVHERRRGHINRFSYVVPFLQAAHYYPYPEVVARVEETGERLRGALAFVFNFPVYGPGLRIAPEARADDGLLDLCVFERPGLGPLLRYLAAVATGRQQALPDLHRRRVRRVSLDGAYAVPVQTDGDSAGWAPVEVEVVPGALALVAPPR